MHIYIYVYILVLPWLFELVVIPGNLENSADSERQTRKIGCIFYFPRNALLMLKVGLSSEIANTRASSERRGRL